MRSTTNEVRDAAWRAKLTIDDGDIPPTMHNLVTILSNDPAWRGVLRADPTAAGASASRWRVFYTKTPPHEDDYANQRPTGMVPVTELDEIDYARLRIYLERKYHVFVPHDSQADLYRAAVIVALLPEKTK